ncbi:hypothetical protein BDW22DRAFT_1370175 [Trametopsis cervina]|nr:hypothetical protein BDW22DRAFT_1370175 [Trametopsis cervina]
MDFGVTSTTSTSLSQGKTLVLCFDGTSNRYSKMNTNVVKIYSYLVKDTDSQVMYYQPGVGTYLQPGAVSPFFQWGAKILDQAVAWFLDDHVRGGYTFLMQNWRLGDKICIFGFSRGAYTARALAGLIHKVGLLPKDNPEQVPMAYKLYKNKNPSGDELAEGFKTTYCRTVSIDFIGVWDTVESVGLLRKKTLPFSSSNAAIKVFRHALSLDDRRAKFRPTLYHRSSPNAKDKSHNSLFGQYASTNTSRVSKPSLEGDVREVWFAGCHSDVGGGSTLSTAYPALSNVSLYWMIREAVGAQCGILFRNDILAMAQAAQGATDPDALETLHDPLKENALWWLLECVPTPYMYQDANRQWQRKWGFNWGRGRHIQEEKPLFHESVKYRMYMREYKPSAIWREYNEEYVW